MIDYNSVLNRGLILILMGVAGSNWVVVQGGQATVSGTYATVIAYLLAALVFVVPAVTAYQVFFAVEGDTDD